MSRGGLGGEGEGEVVILPCLSSNLINYFANSYKGDYQS